jgi:hypothetical protein
MGSVSVALGPAGLRLLTDGGGGGPKVGPAGHWPGAGSYCYEFLFGAEGWTACSFDLGRSQIDLEAQD